MKEQGLKLSLVKPFMTLLRAAIIPVSPTEKEKRTLPHEQKGERETPLNILVLSIVKALLD